MLGLQRLKTMSDMKREREREREEREKEKERKRKRERTPTCLEGTHETISACLGQALG